MPCVALGVASLLVTASAWADEDTKVGAKIFADFTSIDAKSDGTKTSASGLGVDVKRTYVSIAHKFDDIWSANVTTDFQYVSNDSATQVYIKKVYVQARLSDAFVLRAGSADLPWVPFIEDVYGYRFLENVMIDRLKFGTSTDWGLNANGKSGDMFSYSVSLVNGGGYKNPTRTKNMDVEGRAAFSPIEGLTVAAGVYSGKRGQKTEGGAATPNTANRIDAVVAYVNNGLRAGAEYFSAKNWNNVTGASFDDKADGFSVWGSYELNPMWGVFARADSAKLSKNLNPGRKDKYFNLGVVSHPRNNIDVALAYKNDKVSGGTGAEIKYGEVGAWVQVVF
jgi:hypothetical protein